MRIRTHRFSSSSSASAIAHKELVPTENKAEESGAVDNAPRLPQLQKSVAKCSEPDIFRACTLNQSPWDVPRFRAFERQCAEPTAQNSASAKPHQQQQKKRKFPGPYAESTRIGMEHSAKKVNNATGWHCVSTSAGQCREGQTKGAGTEKNVGREERFLGSALQKVLLEAGDGDGDDGFTIRAAGCKLLQLRSEESNSLLGALENQSSKAVINDPHLVELDEGRFALSTQRHRAMENNNNNNSENIDTANEDHRVSSTDGEEAKHLAGSNVIQSERGGGMIGRERGAKRRECGQNLEGGLAPCELGGNRMRSYHSKSSIEDAINGNVNANGWCWDDSVYYYYAGFGRCCRTSGNGKTRMPTAPPRSSSSSPYDVDVVEQHTAPPQRRKPVKARYLKSIPIP